LPDQEIDEAKAVPKLECRNVGGCGIAAAVGFQPDRGSDPALTAASFRDTDVRTGRMNLTGFDLAKPLAPRAASTICAL
jgi:hypothetical protein